MRCIEMFAIIMSKANMSGLTLTWDVLKWTEGGVVFQLKQININMRCIEIHSRVLYNSSCFWLTLTWDVLKYNRAWRYSVRHSD